MNRKADYLEVVESICDRLSERSATLFLGAGVNAGIKTGEGESFPLGQDLGDCIARDLLNIEDQRLPLDEAAEIARFRLGEKAVNDYIYDKFIGFNPGIAHLALVQLPWDVIYTTNYDLLVESAAKFPSLEPAGVIRPVLSIQTDLSLFSEADILYYKLHGSVDLANSADGRLILTKEDYRHYELYRKPLFRRLERDLSSRMFVFIGYSLKDDNFRAILEDCRNELGSKTLPLSFAIRHNFSEVEEIFWRDKYNIQLVNAEADEFLNCLKDTWISQQRSIIPFESRKSKEYLQVDEGTRFPKVMESFYQIRPTDCTGPSNPKLFFLGAEPSWADIRDKIPPERDAYWTIFETLFPELADPSLQPSLYLVTGAAGTGKTTLIRSISYALAREFDVPVLVHIPGTPLDTRFLGPLVDAKDPRRIIIVVRNAAESIAALERFMEEAKQKSLPLTVILEERRNQWNGASLVVRNRLTPAEFELGTLSRQEIERILDALGAHGALGKLTGASREYQEEHFIALAHKDLLVALRELTSEASFDDIVRDEFTKIPSALAKRAYVYVSALGQFDLPIRYETLVHLLALRYDQLGTEIFLPTAGVLISGEESGRSRHNIGFRLSARHPIIASIIFAHAASDDESKFEIFNTLLTQLDPGFPEDRRLLNSVIRRREIVEVFASHEKRRAIYERLEAILPDDPYVFQHRSRLERELENPELAIHYARKALKLDPRNVTFQNTLGLALEFAARFVDDPMRRQAWISEASKLFEDGIRNDPGDPYGYIGKIFILRQAINREVDSQRKALLQADVLSLLEEAFETTGESQIIAHHLAQQRDQLGSVEEAIAVLKVGLDKDPTNTRLRDLWIRLEGDRGHYQEALQIALEGSKFDPTSWRIQRHIARLKRVLGDPIDAVVGHYEAAIRHHKSDVTLMVELGAYLFINHKYSKANIIFSQARDLPITGNEKQKVREWWTTPNGEKIIYSGIVKSIRGASAIAIAIPDNFEVFFWRSRAKLSDLRENDPIRFTVGFNAFGPIASVIV